MYQILAKNPEICDLIRWFSEEYALIEHNIALNMQNCALT
ncbi:hypothetical protein VIC_000143 [Vibrio coralliilyticus ATCC BAA-450]|nr:hypothetical protein VIC_000143 [Vibrio coralliilyticus ATCC BAA-450]ERB62473.1 hypothetical protein N779_26085 [Vibrio coralliilyticus OCN008]